MGFRPVWPRCQLWINRRRIHNQKIHRSPAAAKWEGNERQRERWESSCQRFWLVGFPSSSGKFLVLPSRHCRKLFGLAVTFVYLSQRTAIYSRRYTRYDRVTWRQEHSYQRRVTMKRQTPISHPTTSSLTFPYFSSGKNPDSVHQRFPCYSLLFLIIPYYSWSSQVRFNEIQGNTIQVKLTSC